MRGSRSTAPTQTIKIGTLLTIVATAHTHRPTLPLWGSPPGGLRWLQNFYPPAPVRAD